VNGVALQMLVDLQAGNPVPAVFMLAIESVISILHMATPPQTEYLTLVYKTDNHTRIAYNLVMEASRQLNIARESLEIVVTEKLSTRQLEFAKTDTFSLGNIKDNAKIIREAQIAAKNSKHAG